jgi:hypothetical protein
MILRLSISIALLGATLFAFPAAAQTAPSPAEAEEALVMQLRQPHCLPDQRAFLIQLRC